MGELSNGRGGRGLDTGGGVSKRWRVAAPTVALAFLMGLAVLAGPGWAADAAPATAPSPAGAALPLRQPRTLIRGVLQVWPNAILDHGKTLLATTNDNDLGLWNIADGKEIARIKVGKPMICQAVSADGALVAVGSPMNSLTLCDLKTHAVIGSIGRGDSVTGAVFSADGKVVADVTIRGSVTFSEVASQKKLRSIELGNTGGVRLISSPDHAHFLAVTQRGDIFLLAFDSESPVPLPAQPAAAGDGSPGSAAPMGVGMPAVMQIADPVFSPDGKIIASGSVDHAVRLWDAATGKPLGRLEHKTGLVRVAAFSADGKLLASAAPGEVSIWRMSDRKVLAQLPAAEIQWVGFSPDGAELATASAKAVRLWNVASGKPTADLALGEGGTYQFVFPAEGHVFVTCGVDRTVRLWDYPPSAGKGPTP